MSRKIRHKRPLVIAARIVLCLMALTALLADFIANDQPIIGRHQQGHLISLITDSQDVDPGELAWAIYPPIRYHSSTLDFENTNYTPPLTRNGNRGMHWLGTDLIGRDVAAGMVYGCRYSLFTAVLAVLITLLIGLPLGLLAGYVGNRGVGVDGQSLFDRDGSFTYSLLPGFVFLVYHLDTTFHLSADIWCSSKCFKHPEKRGKPFMAYSIRSGNHAYA